MMTNVCKTPIKWIALGACTVLMSGCSWLPFGGGKAHHGQTYGGQYGVQQAAYGGPNCQVPHAQAPIPMGCDPAAVTIGTNGFSQQPSFGAGYGAGAASPYGAHKTAHAPQSTTGGYGSHAAHGGGVNYGRSVAAGKPQLRKPRWRGQFSVGVEKSVMGTYLDPTNGFPVAYDPADFSITTVTPQTAPTDGVQTTTTLSARDDGRRNATISQDDAHSTPLSLRAGAEYIVNPRMTVFGSAGYTYSEGKTATVTAVEGFVTRETSEQTFTGGAPDGAPVVTVTEDPNVTDLATFDYEFSDLNRVDLQLGGRYYFDSLKNAGLAKVTPFVSAAAGASHINEQSAFVTQNQLNYQTREVNTIRPPGGIANQVVISDSQWVPTAELNTGIEWQASPRTAIAMETGIRFEGGRDYANGNDEDTNIAIPFTIRGSYNF